MSFVVVSEFHLAADVNFHTKITLSKSIENKNVAHMIPLVHQCSVSTVHTV